MANTTVRTPGSLLRFPPENFGEYLEQKSVSELVSIIEDAREFGLSVINAEYEQFEEAMDNASD